MSVLHLTHRAQIRTASSLLMVAGVWLLVMPLLLQVSPLELVAQTTAGTLLILGGWSQMYTNWSWPSWTTLYIGLSLTILPFFWSQAGSAFIQVLTGIIIVALSAWDEAEVSSSERV